MRTTLFTALALLAAAVAARGGDWPSFRGPGGTGLTDEATLPTTWSADKGVAWKAKVAGRGWSSPIVWKDRVFLTAASSEQDAQARPGGGGGGRPPGGGFGRPRVPDVPFKYEVVCLDRNTGDVVWKKLAVEAKPKIPTHGSNTYASETPATDGERVYAYFGMTGLFCFDLDGKQLWTKDLGAYQMQMGWGTSSSPVADGGKVFVQVDNEEKSFLVAFDGKTGDEAWKVSRSEKSVWASPIVWKNKVRTELVTVGASKARSYDPATGKVLWELSLGGGRCSASPVADDERVYVGIGGRGGFGGGRPGGPPGGGGQPGGGGGGGGGGLFAVKAGASGDITPKAGETTSDGVAWKTPNAGPPMSSPLVYRGYIYVLEHNGGQASCYDAKTGKAAYSKERIPGARTFWASPWGHDGKVFCLDDSGTTHVLKAGPGFEVVGKNSLGDTTWATPALAGGSLIVRGTNSVYAIKP